jgi:capsule polysaccharide export protein KpsE/RkpR
MSITNLSGFEIADFAQAALTAEEAKPTPDQNVIARHTSVIARHKTIPALEAQLRQLRGQLNTAGQANPNTAQIASLVAQIDTLHRQAGQYLS